MIIGDEMVFYLPEGNALVVTYDERVLFRSWDGAYHSDTEITDTQAGPLILALYREMTATCPKSS